MFQFPSYASFSYVFTKRYQLTWWVAPFGHLRIKVCVPLPEAFRSLPRPSSHSGANFHSLEAVNLRNLLRL